MQYYTSGLPWNENFGGIEHPHRYNGKEFVEMHGLDEYDSEARWYYPALGRTTTIDPLAEQYYNISPYAWCGNNMVNVIDPDGKRPIYSLEGDLLGTDETGLQGDAVFMDSKLFKQNMSSEIATSFDVGVDFLSEESFKKFTNNFSNLSSRPDWDGYITLKEANDWYRNGNGQALFADLGKIDLSGIASLGEKYVGQVKNFNLLFTSNSINAGLVYGTITLKRYPNHKVKAYSDFYDFDMKPWTNFRDCMRNIETIIGKKVAGEGIPYPIDFYGSQTLKPILPWIK